MTTARIRAAFETRLAASGIVPATAIAWENRAFTPPAPTLPYLRAFLLPAPTTSLTLERTHRQYLGVYQVSVYLPANQAIGTGQALVDQIVALFPVAVPMVQDGLSVWCEEPMSQGSALQDAERLVIPLSAPYQAHTV